jgi:hypothetical protein
VRPRAPLSKFMMASRPLLRWSVVHTPLHEEGGDRLGLGLRVGVARVRGRVQHSAGERCGDDDAKQRPAAVHTAGDRWRACLSAEAGCYRSCALLQVLLRLLQLRVGLPVTAGCAATGAGGGSWRGHHSCTQRPTAALTRPHHRSLRAGSKAQICPQ